MNLPSIYTQPVEGLENFEMSGDDLAVISNSYHQIEDKNVAVATHANERCDRHNQCQITQKENEMNTPNSTQTGSVKHPSWAVPVKMQTFGTDIVHNGTTYSLERSNSNGDEYSLRATVTQLEEIGHGFTTDPYVSLDVDSGPFGITHLNLDIAELETMADWLCGLVEKVQHLKPKP